MSEYTRPATWEDVKRVAEFLNAAGVEYALVGGYALAAHGFSRFTEDVDFLVEPSPENARRWIVALSRLPDGAARELTGEADPFAADRRYAIRINDEFTVDVLPSVAGRTWAELSPHVETIDVGGVKLRVLSLEGLLLTKQGARPKDRMDAELLRQAMEALEKDKG